MRIFPIILYDQQMELEQTSLKQTLFSCLLLYIFQYIQYQARIDFYSCVPRIFRQSFNCNLHKTRLIRPE